METGEKDNFDKAVCVLGICMLTIDLIIYGISFIYVIYNAKKRNSLRKFGKIPLLIIAFPNLYFFVGLVGRITVYVKSPTMETCFLYND